MKADCWHTPDPTNPPAFVCHHNSLLIYGSLKTPTLDRFAKVTHYSVGVSTAACLAMGLAGFLTFGDRTQGNVLNNFPADADGRPDVLLTLARLCFGLNMLTTLPLEAFVCREVMLNYYFPGEPFSMNLHLVLSSALVVSAMTVSLLTCDVGAVFDLVGATSACALAYILPPLCYIRLSSTRSWRTYAAAAVVAFGFLVMTISVLQALGKMITGRRVLSSLPLSLSLSLPSLFSLPIYISIYLYIYIYACVCYLYCFQNKVRRVFISRNHQC